ncbi:MAG: exodeoxyribonuclease VII large subunit [Clostridia bacterium]
MMKNFTLSVLQLNNYIKNIFDAEEMLIGVSVFGEVSNFKVSGTSAYFDLKEEGASISCVMFSYSSNIKNGDKLLITGKLNFHIKLGKLSFIVQKTELQGQGELYQKYLELKAKLEREGLFDERNKKSLPKFAQHIGVITSKTGAVIRDIINVTRLITKKYVFATLRISL